MSYWLGLVIEEIIRIQCELGKIRGKTLNIPLFAERKVCLEKEIHIWNQHFISYKKVLISITFEKVVEILYCGNLTHCIDLLNLLHNGSSKCIRFTFFVYNSAVYNHHLETGHIIGYNNTKILDRADSDRKLQIKELLHIDQKKPTLNIQLNSQSEFRINVNIIG